MTNQERITNLEKKIAALEEQVQGLRRDEPLSPVTSDGDFPSGQLCITSEKKTT